MQDRKKDTDVYTRLLDSEGEGEGGMILEIGIETCIISYMKFRKMAMTTLYARQEKRQMRITDIYG